MKTSTQLKALIRNMSKLKGLEAEVILRHYMLEKLLEKISLSSYKDNFILKGGMLIAAMVGMESRSTMDMDATIKGFDLSKEEIETVFSIILNIEINDDISMQLKSVEDIREEAEYPGVRVAIEAILDKTKQILKFDITTGDIITPKEIRFDYKLMFEDRTLNIKAYNLETVLAEKLETIIIRGVTNTRMRDFYDVYVLTKLYSDNIDKSVFSSALKNTAKKRETISQFKTSNALAYVSLKESGVMIDLWKRYQSKYSYAVDISWQKIIESIQLLLSMISKDILQ